MRPRITSRFLEVLLYALTAFGPFAFGCVEPWSLSILEILVFLLALACFLGGRGPASPEASWFWLLPVTFAALGTLQLLTPAAADGPRPLLPFTVAPYATRAAILLWGAYAALLWSVPRVIVTHTVARRYVSFLFGLGLALAALGFVQRATGDGRIYWLRDAAASPFGPYYNRDHAANLLLMSMAAGIGILCSLSGPLRSGEGTPKERMRRQLLAAGGVLFLFAGIAVCGSRGAFLSMPLSGALVALLGADFAGRASARRARAAAALAAVGVFVFLAFRHVASSADAGALMDRSVTVRLSIYRDAWRGWRDSPLFGTGLGSFGTVFPSYQDMDLRATVRHAHSDWLELALEAGLAGLAAGLAASALAAFLFLRAWRGARSGEMRAIIGGGLAAVAAFALHSLFDFSFQVPGNAVIFFGIVGFLLSAPSWADKAAVRVEPKPPAAWEAFAGLTCFLFLAVSASRPAAAAWHARTWRTSGEKAVAMLRAYDQNEDPRFLRRAAGALVAASKGTDVHLMRASLVYALAATKLRPFDFGDLEFTGRLLRRLGRAADADVFHGQADLVYFVGIKPAGRR